MARRAVPDRALRRLETLDLEPDIALDAALHDSEVAFNRVGVHEAAVAHVFVGTVGYSPVACKFTSDPRVDQALVDHWAALAAGDLDDSRARRFGVNVCDMIATDVALALHQRDNGG